ncbi:MAG: hypothetical protein ACYS99_04890 [Planctomycetota bacterium]
MTRLLARIRSVLRRGRASPARRLSPAQAQVLRRNLRALLDTKEFLSEEHETAA